MPKAEQLWKNITERLEPVFNGPMYLKGFGYICSVHGEWREYDGVTEGWTNTNRCECAEQLEEREARRYESRIRLHCTECGRFCFSKTASKCYNWEYGYAYYTYRCSCGHVTSTD